MPSQRDECHLNTDVATQLGELGFERFPRRLLPADTESLGFLDAFSGSGERSAEWSSDAVHRLA